MELLEQKEFESSGPTPLSQPAELELKKDVQTKKGFWAYLQSFLKALCSRKKQVSSHPCPKTAQDWRDEFYAKNPWWGNGV
jgi:hypothetical protein